MDIAHRRDRDGTEQKLSDHLFGVSEKAKYLAAKIGLQEHGELMGLVHDLGKYSRAFQSYIKSATGTINIDEDDFVDAKGLRGKIDHSSAGAQLIWQELRKHGALGKITGQLLALCLASHHSGLIDCIGASGDFFGDNLFIKRMKKPNEKTHYEEVLAVADTFVLKRVHALVNNEEIIAKTKKCIGRIIKAQSKTDDKTPIARFQIGLLVRFLFSVLIDSDRIDSADFERPEGMIHRQYGRYKKWDILIDRLEKRLQQFKLENPIDTLRREISQHCLQAASRAKGVYTLTVPTGGGKTLASLRFSLHHACIHGMERIIYVIPFTSIIDQNADQVRTILEPNDAPGDKGKIVLEHHTNLIPERQGWRDKILSENWDAPLVFTTMVQLLETVFGSGTRGARRMHQLANAVLVFDEIQTIPVKCIHLFNNAMNFLVEQCGSTVVLCTATQPLLHRVAKDKGAIHLAKLHEIVPDTERFFKELKRVQIIDSRKPGGWDSAEVAGLAIREAEKSGSCLVIVNTKKAAKQVFENSLNSGEGLEVCHLSTNMCPAHRRAVLKEVNIRLKANCNRSSTKFKPLVCVSTQLIEAGVDVDFGSVIRLLAGIDSIAQAAGRCNRNGIQKMGRAHIINSRNENLDMLPDIRIARDKAEKIIDDIKEKPKQFGNDLLTPEAMSWYYENYFFARKDEMSYPVSRRRIGHDDDLFNLLSSNKLAVADYASRHGFKPDIYMQQAFMTAARMFETIGAPTQGVIVQYGDTGRKLVAALCAAFEVDKQYNLVREAQQFSVNVFPNVMQHLIENGAVRPVQEGSGILYLDERFYSATFGLSEKPIEEWRFNCV